MLRPTTISEVPVRNQRPSMMCTWGRSWMPSAGSPRTTTFCGLSLPFFGIWVSTSVSFDTSGVPSAPRATSRIVSRSEAWSRYTALWISVWDAWRRRIALSRLPVDTSVLRRPASSISTAANTNTTSAMPPAVRSVVIFLVHKFLKMYENGIFNGFYLCSSVFIRGHALTRVAKPLDDANVRRPDRGRDAGQHAHRHARGELHGDRLRRHVEHREQGAQHRLEPRGRREREGDAHRAAQHREQDRLAEDE